MVINKALMTHEHSVFFYTSPSMMKGISTKHRV